MDREETLYLIPYLLSLMLTLGVFIYTWGHRYVRGAKTYTWFMGGQTLTILGFIFELISPNIQTKILWDKFQWLTDTFLVIIPFLIFAVQFSEHKLRHPRLTRAFWISLPILFTLILLTDNIHHLVYPDPHLGANQPFPDLVYSYTYVVYGYSLLFVYGANFWGIGLLIKRAVQPYNPYRFQFWTVALGFLIPILLSIFTFAGIKIAPQRDISPFSFAIGNLIVAWGLFRYGLFDIIPIAREHIVENMVDPIIVLDADNRVVDINPAAVKGLGKQVSDVLGKPTVEVFEDWPVIAHELETLDTEQKELAVKRKDGISYFDLNISPIFNNRGRLLGKIVVARDVTRHKTLEAGYRTLSAELEQRVNDRTEEVQKAAEQYRAVVENQTEFIVRWKPDRTRTFVNDAYCRHFDLTYEEAMQNDFMTLIDENDRGVVEEKIARLSSGTSDVETEIHRVLNPDGSIGWQEWTDQAIRGESGELIEFQSVGRDVTRRKRDEQLLLRELDFDTLMTRLLTGFAISAHDEVDASIETTLEEVVKFFEGDFSDILLLSEDKTTWTATHHWSSPYLQQTSRFESTIPVGVYRWTEGKLFRGESVRINTLDDYPPEAEHDRKFGKEVGLKSLLGIPIRGKDDLVFGILNIGSYKNHIEWSDSDVTHLRIIGDTIVNTLERKHAEAAMHKSEMKHRLLFESANDSIFIMKDAQFIDCNSKTLEMFGCERGQIVGKTPIDFSPDTQPDGQSSKLKAHEKISGVLNGIPQFFEWKHARLDGTLFDAEVSLSLLEFDNETLIQAIVRDITKRKKAEEALRKSEEKFSKAFRLSPTIIIISNLEQEMLIEVNEAFEEVTGFTRDEAIGKSTLDLGLWLSPQDQEPFLSVINAKGEIKNKEIHFQAKDGSPVIGLVSAELIELDGEKCVLSTVEDITERKKTEEDILRLNRLYVTISQINQTIVRVRDKSRLFSRICQVAIDHGQFRMAWIGLIDETGKYVEPATFAGAELEYLKNVRVDFHDKVLGGGPTGLAIREEHCIICQDIATDPRMAPWKDTALQRGYRSSAAVPIREHGRVIGTLNVYASETHGFAAEDEELLEQIGEDISFALDSIDHETKRRRAEKNLAEAYDITLEGWAKALELRDKETEGHSRRVTETTVALARAMDISEEEIEHIQRGSILHDIGKMGVPDEILRKNGPLTKEERDVILKHPTTAYNLLKPITYLEKALDIPYCHHEKWDGSGYPRGLKGEEIPIAARIFAVVDVWDALSSDRPYRDAWPQDKVIQYLKEESGGHFDPNVLDLFLQMVEKGEI